MKKTLFLFAVSIFALAITSCTNYTCPTYAQVEVEQQCNADVKL